MHNGCAIAEPNTVSRLAYLMYHRPIVGIGQDNIIMSEVATNVSVCQSYK